MTDRKIYSQAQFHARVLEEWRRSERSGKRKILVLLQGLNAHKDRAHILELIDSAFRETDVFGWHVAEESLGILLVELGKSEVPDALHTIRNKIRTQVLDRLNGRSAGITVEFHLLPRTFERDETRPTRDPLHEMWTAKYAQRQTLDGVKRVMDICASSLLLTAFLPLFILIALGIRLSSPGPAFFRQWRVGFRGRPFPLYKFRTMSSGCDDQAHREYVSKFISGEAEQYQDDRGQTVYKITDDPRITPFGRLLRRTSLDELPQLWNVLRGEMSMVGPRPPLPYEVERYDLWHLRRVFDLKPGVTGVWQVRGRSRCTFDEMTRMDLQHAKPHSMGLYLQVLLETPTAMIHGHGAH